MCVANRIGDFAPETAAWRKWKHGNPEPGFACHGNAAFLAGGLRDIGIDEIHEGGATTGDVAKTEGQGEGPFVPYPAHDFIDRIAPIGASFIARLVERAQPAEA